MQGVRPSVAEPSAWAGADIITTNNYAVVPSCLQLCEDFEGGEEGVRKLVAAAGKAARAACAARPGRSVRVAGCLPPLHESYRPDRVGSFEDNLAHYRLIAAAIAPFADLLLCETMSTALEAKAALTAASCAPPPAPAPASTASDG